MYTALENINAQISEATVIQLTDDEGLGVVEQTRIDEAIASADAIIDGYCSARYIVPFAPVPAIIAKCSLDMAIYNLYARRVEVMPEVRDKNNTAAVNLLKAIAKGDVILAGAITPPAQAGSSRTAEITSQPRQFTRDKLRGL